MTPADKLLFGVAIFVSVIFILIPMIMSRRDRNRFNNNDDSWW